MGKDTGKVGEFCQSRKVGTMRILGKKLKGNILFG